MRGLKTCKKCKDNKHIDNFFYPDNKVLKYSKFCNSCTKQIEKKNNTKDSNKDKILKKTYNISLDEYNQIFNEQGGRCDICKTHQSLLNKVLSVDHCHKGGFVRGLLCSSCNVAIGLLKENKDILAEAILYLTKHKPHF